MNKVILLLAIFFIACQGDEDANRYWGEAKAFKNKISWQSKTYAAYDRNRWGEDYIDITMDNFDNFIGDVLYFSKVPMKLGEYQVEGVNFNQEYKGVGSSYHTIQGGDVLGDSFVLDTMRTTNKVEILSFDKSAGAIEFRFSVTFIISKRQTNQSADTVRFENGYVKTRAFN
jgi:hypothetical protein